VRRKKLLEGEDAAAYDQLFARICSAVKPVDIIEEIFVADLVSLEWEVLRWRRYAPQPQARTDQPFSSVAQKPLHLFEAGRRTGSL
jgi:hypothetical protein